MGSLNKIFVTFNLKKKFLLKVTFNLFSVPLSLCLCLSLYIYTDMYHNAYDVLLQISSFYIISFILIPKEEELARL